MNRHEPEGFKEFWDIWRPNARHTDGRGAAREAFAKHMKAGASPQDIIDGAKCFFRTMKDRDREFVPLSATWLNRGAYEDLAIQERAYQDRKNTGNVVPINRPIIVTAPEPAIPEQLSEQDKENRRQMVARLRAKGVIGRTMQ